MILDLCALAGFLVSTCFFGMFANPSNFFYVANVFLAFFFSVKVQYLNAVMYFYICTNSLRPWEGAAGGGGG